MAEEETYFYEWEEIGKNWITSERAFDEDYPSKPHDPGDSLAAFVIEDVFNLELEAGSENLGSYLPGYDVRDRDAYQMVQLSLTAELVNNKVIECYATEEGKIKFFEIGVNNSNIKNYVLYEINSGEVKAKCDKVLVEGYDPPPKRFTKATPYNLFTFAAKNLDEAAKDEDVNEYPRYHLFGETLGPERCDFFREGSIEYGKLDFDVEYAILSDTYNEDAYKTMKVPQKIHKIEVPFYQAGSTDVNFRNTTSRYIELNKFGELQTRTWLAKSNYMPSMCKPEDDIDPKAGVYLPESNKDKFLRVSAVYIWGYLVTNIRSGETSSYSSSSADFEVDLETTLSEPFKLNEGQDYLVRKRKEGGYKIIFSCNVSENYKQFFGYPTVKSIYFRIGWNNIFKDNACTTFAAPIAPFTDIQGYLKDGKTQVNSSAIHNVALFPLNEGQSAYALPFVGDHNTPKVIVVYEWDNPSIQITDLRNEVNDENLRKVKAEFYPIIIKDELAPKVVCDKGGITVLDPTEVIPDREKDTVENFAGAEYTKAARLENGDISVVMPFADKEGCKTIAQFIYTNQNRIASEVTYTCDPDAKPALGELIDGNVINSIDYSYQDSSQYFISVKAGSIWQGMNSWSQSLYNMKTETVQEEGLVISINKDNVTCHVDLKHLGIMECINVSKEKLEKGDKVQVTVQNNPVIL
jgi:hypothetical protein